MMFISSASMTIRSLPKHAAIAALLIVQVAIAMAVLCNLFTVVLDASQRSRAHSGLSESHIAVVQNIGIIGLEEAAASSAAGLRAMRAVPGITMAAIGPAPFAVERGDVYLEPSRELSAARPYIYFGSESLSDTLGVSVLQGVGLRTLRAPAVEDALQAGGSLHVPAVVTSSLSKRLFPAGSPLGRIIHAEVWGSYPIALRIVGVVADFRSASTRSPSDSDAVIAEVKIESESIGGLYVARRSSSFDHRGKQGLLTALSLSMPGFVQEPVRTVAELRVRNFRKDVARSQVLLLVATIVTVSSALGVFGLTHFWVSRRRWSTAIRRALGASRRDVVVLFATESALISSIGVLAGTGLAILMNVLLGRQVELVPVNGLAMVAGAGVTFFGCSVAAIIPAFSAAKVEPALAFRLR
ncbi:FtsX-like permease family protein [Stenotrophomonas maltophilia]|nr:FtsX-like permease family protein [Stenotrophomonas maltophilia]